MYLGNNEITKYALAQTSEHSVENKLILTDIKYIKSIDLQMKHVLTHWFWCRRRAQY